MKILQAYKFQLRPKMRHSVAMGRFAGSCRFVWNRALALEKENYEKHKKRLGYYKLAGLLKAWKSESETIFLREVHSQILQQSLKDLDRAYKSFFEKRTDFPKFKKKGAHDSFRYPQGFRLDEINNRIFLPKIGWIRYRQSRKIEGVPKQVTVSRYAGNWYASIQTEREISEPKPISKKEIGIDLGVARFATFSNGRFFLPIDSYRKIDEKLAKCQRKLAKKVKFSANWLKTKVCLQRIHRKKADIRRDFLHKITTDISKNHAFVVIEDLKVKNMSKSASGTAENPGHNVRAKAKLNKSILDQGWFEFRRMLNYKLAWKGGRLVVISPQFTSQMCSKCGFVDAKNRETQAKFHCRSCGFELNADQNAARNILAAGLAASACGV